MTKFQRDARLVSSHQDSIKGTLVWPTYDFSTGETLSPQSALSHFGIAEVHSMNGLGRGLIYTHRLPHDDDKRLKVPMTADGWLFKPSPHPISLVTPRGIISRTTLQTQVRSSDAYATYKAGGCPITLMDW